jgi:hypothetical protein
MYIAYTHTTQVARCQKKLSNKKPGLLAQHPAEGDQVTETTVAQ